ncbi:MAG: hypothetical protein ACSLEY_02280 [Candidatus Saccharimonadales bacterium]
MELIKVTSNTFLALKISFANSVAKLTDEANADITEVMQAVWTVNASMSAYIIEKLQDALDAGLCYIGVGC